MKKTIFVILISLLFFSCSDSDISDENVGLNFDQNTFEENRQLWELNKNINYKFSQEYSSSSAGPQPKITSIVLNNKLDSIFIQPQEGHNVSLEMFKHYETVDDVFDEIEFFSNYYKERINSDKSNIKGVEIDIIYDSTYSYPTRINCKGYYFEPILGGIGFSIVISDFEVLP
jgi:hypothetical protein